MADPAELDKAMIVNWALSELGLAANFSIDDRTQLGAKIDIWWPRAVARCFGVADWTFCRQTFRLTRRAQAPETGYLYAFDLPAGRIGEPLKLLADPRNHDRPWRDFRIEGDELHADAENLWAVCKMERDPRNWDRQFADCFATALAGYLAVPLTQDVEMAAAKAAEAFGTAAQGGAGGKFGRLIAQNAAAHPKASPLYLDDPLTAGRVADGYPWWGG